VVRIVRIEKLTHVAGATYTRCLLWSMFQDQGHPVRPVTPATPITCFWCCVLYARQTLCQILHNRT